MLVRAAGFYFRFKTSKYFSANIIVNLALTVVHLLVFLQLVFFMIPQCNAVVVFYFLLF